MGRPIVSCLIFREKQKQLERWILEQSLNTIRIMCYHVMKIPRIWYCCSPYRHRTVDLSDINVSGWYQPTDWSRNRKQNKKKNWTPEQMWPFYMNKKWPGPSQFRIWKRTATILSELMSRIRPGDPPGPLRDGKQEVEAEYRWSWWHRSSGGNFWHLSPSLWFVNHQLEVGFNH